MLFAQVIDSVPSSFWKYFCISLLVLLGAAAAVVLIIVSFRRPEPVELNDHPPIEVRKAAKRYNHELTENRFAEIDRRLAAHDAELERIQSDRAETLKHINRRFERVLVGIASIAGKVGAKLPGQETEE